MELSNTLVNPPQGTEFDHMKIVLLRLLEKGIITDIQKQQIESKAEINDQKLEVYELMSNLEWKSAVRILQLIKFIKTDQQNLMTSERNPLLIDPITKHIFGFFSHGELREFRLVCKKWDDIADPVVKKNSIATFSNFKSGERTLMPTQEFLTTFQHTKIPITKFHFAKTVFLMVDLDDFFNQYGIFITEVYFYDCDFAFHGNKLQNYDMTNWLRNCPKIEELRIVSEMNSIHLIITLDAIPRVRTLRLKNCSVNIRTGFQIHPIDVFLSDVTFRCDGFDLPEFCINDAIDFSKVKVAEIDCGTCECTAILDVSTSTNTDKITIEALMVNAARIKNSGEGNWTVKNLYLNNVDFLEVTKMEIINLYFSGNSTVDLFALPSSIEKLLLSDPETIVTCSQPMILPKLTSLNLQGNISAILHFLSCSNLVELELKSYGDIEENIDFSEIPRTVQKMKLCGITVEDSDDEPIHLLKLIMVNYSFADAFYLTKLFPPELTVLQWDCKDTFEVPESFVKFMLNFTLNFFVVGSFRNLSESSQLHNYVDASGNNYIFRGRRGMAIDNAEFMQFMELSYDEVLKKHHLPPFHL